MAQSITVPKGREGWYFELESKPWIFQEIYRDIMAYRNINYRQAVQVTNTSYNLYFVSYEGQRYFKIGGLETWILNNIKQNNDYYSGGVQEEPSDRDDSDHADRVRK